MYASFSITSRLQSCIPAFDLAGVLRGATVILWNDCARIVGQRHFGYEKTGGGGGGGGQAGKPTKYGQSPDTSDSPWLNAAQELQECIAAVRQ